MNLCTIINELRRVDKISYDNSKVQLDIHPEFPLLNTIVLSLIE